MGVIAGTLGGAALGGAIGHAVGEEIAVGAQTLAFRAETEEGAWLYSELEHRARPLGLLSGVVIGGSVGLVTTPKSVEW